MIARHLAESMKADLAEYPVVTLFGPRQAGKTTLVKSVCEGFDFLSMEDKETRDAAKSDYKAFFKNHPPPLIIDEVQRLPEIVSAVQTIVDSRRDVCGQFVLTGSQQTLLAEAVDESLAGRTSVLDLLPLSVAELAGKLDDVSTDECMIKGFMPELHANAKRPLNYYRSYFRTYVERDVRRVANIKDILLFERFVSLLAGRVGQVVNFTSLANETGVSVSTISSWVGILEASFLIFRLPPYFTNLSKRLVKSPKVYFTDVGLVSYLLGIENAKQMQTHPLRGQIFENMVVADIRKSFTNRGRDPRMSFYRTEKGFEVDLILEEAGKIMPIEIKSCMTYNKNLTKNLEVFCESCSSASCPMLVYDGDRMHSLGAHNILAANWRTWRATPCEM